MSPPSKNIARSYLASCERRGPYDPKKKVLRRRLLHVSPEMRFQTNVEITTSASLLESGRWAIHSVKRNLDFLKRDSAIRAIKICHELHSQHFTTESRIKNGMAGAPALHGSRPAPRRCTKVARRPGVAPAKKRRSFGRRRRNKWPLISLAQQPKQAESQYG